MTRPARILPRYSFALLLLLLSVALTACGGSSNKGSGDNTGSLATQITWPGQVTQSSPSSLNLVSAPTGGGIQPMAAPTGVDFIKITVTGSSFTTEKEFNAADGSGTISNIPAPSTVSITVEGLASSGGTVLYLGQKLGVPITVGGTRSETISMTLVDSTPPPAPTVTSPSENPYYTNPSLTTFSGVCTDNTHTVTLTGEGPDQVGISCAADGTYSFTVPPPVGPEGLFTYTITQKKTLTGLVSSEATFAVIVDQTDPSSPGLSTPNGGTATSSDNTLEIAGACEIGATVTLAGGDSQTASCTDGTFAFTVTQTDDGNYFYTVNQTDKAGNTPTATSVIWTRDSSPVSSIPPTPTITTPSSRTVTTNVAGGTFTISGGCVDGNTMTLTGTTPPGPQTCGSGGNPANTYSFTVTKPAAGTYTYSVVQNDGTASAPAWLSWTLDTTPPAAAPIINSPGFPEVTTGPEITISGICVAGNTVNLSDDTGTPTDASKTTQCTGDNTFSLTYAKPNDGTYNITFTQTDRAGNESPSTGTLTWTREVIPPAPVVTAPSPATLTTNGGSLTISGSCSSAFTTKIILNNNTTPVADCSGGFFNLEFPAPWGGDAVFP